MGQAIHEALDLLEARKAVYRRAGIPYYRPWALMITDGEPTDSWETAAERVRISEEEQKVAFFAVAVDQANLATLSRIAPPSRPPRRLAGLSFRELFLWLSASQKRVSASRVGDQVALPPAGWATV